MLAFARWLSSSGDIEASTRILDEVLLRVEAAGFAPISADVTIVAEAPRLAPHMGAMAEILSSKLGVPVSVKATTTEQLGALGRAEGIAALSVALLEVR